MIGSILDSVITLLKTIETIKWIVSFMIIIDSRIVEWITFISYSMII